MNIISSIMRSLFSNEPERDSQNNQSPLQRRTLHRPGLDVVLKQAKRDFVGKDVQQTTTYSYVWSADQAGHFMLGFVPTFIISWIFEVLHGSNLMNDCFIGGTGRFIAAGLVLIVWTALEIYDFWDSMNTIRESSNYFPPNKENLLWNVVTALIYFGLGAIVAAFSGFSPLAALTALICLFILQLPVAIWWLRRKIIFQQAGLPYLYRLPNYDGKFNADEKIIQDRITPFIKQLLEPSNKMNTEQEASGNIRRHLVISGPQNSGKTALSVGIGTEFAFNDGIGRYVTMSWLVQYIAHKTTEAIDRKNEPNQPFTNSKKIRSLCGRRTVPSEQEFDDGRALWHWASVDLIIIDDVVELLLPVRRMVENELKNGSFCTKFLEEIRINHSELIEQLGGEERATGILKTIAEDVQIRLKDFVDPKQVAKYVAVSFNDVIQSVKKIPRVVWVLGEMIQTDLFNDFVQKSFEVTQANFLAVGLNPAPNQENLS